MAWNEEIRQNLRDAGCPEKLILQYETLEAARNGGPDERRQEQLLCAYRKELLTQLHASQRRLECLDYLLYRLRNAAGAVAPGRRKP